MPIGGARGFGVLNVVLIGASTRAMAFSALRAGLEPICVDLFGDADLARVCRVKRIAFEEYPHGFTHALADLPSAPLLYGGSLENYPDLFRGINQPLWGNPAHVLAKVRNPSRLAEAWVKAGVLAPRTIVDADQARKESPCRWLVKPRRSGAGLNIRPWTGGSFSPDEFHLQECLDGPTHSGLFLATRDGSTRFLGSSLVLAGTDWLHASRFGYAGNVGPLPLTSRKQQAWQRIGDTVTREFGLLGLFGVDAIHHEDVPWPIEVNPRYTASVEIYERASERSLLAEHRAVFDEAFRTSPFPNSSGESTPVHGKAIYYAKEAFTFPNVGPWSESLRADPPWDAEYADIPHPGERMEAGQPVLTMFAKATNIENAAETLREKSANLDRWLAGR